MVEQEQLGSEPGMFCSACGEEVSAAHGFGCIHLKCQEDIDVLKVDARKLAKLAIELDHTPSCQYKMLPELIEPLLNQARIVINRTGG